MQTDHNAFPEYGYIWCNGAEWWYSDTLSKLVRDGNLNHDAPMNNSTSYAGYEPNNEYPTTATESFSLEIDPENTAHITFKKHNYTEKINYRIGFFPTNSQYGVPMVSGIQNRWTNLQPGTTSELTYTGQVIYTDIVSGGSKYFNMSEDRLYYSCPVYSTDISKFVFMPEFTFVEIPYVNGTPSNSNWSYSNDSFALVKPADKRPAGARYDSELWENGYKYNRDADGNITSLKMCTGCNLIPYVGVTDSTWNGSSYSDVHWTKVPIYNYGVIFDPNPEQWLNTANQMYMKLFIYGEKYDPVTDSVKLFLPAGISYHDYNSRGNQNGNKTFGGITLNYGTFDRANIATTYLANPRYSGPGWMFTCLQSKNDENDLRSTFTYVCEGDFPEIDLDYSNVNEYVTQDSGNGYVWSFEGNALTATTKNFNIGLGFSNNNRPYSMQKLWNTIASFGVYVAASDADARNAQIMPVVGGVNSDNIYCGFMDENGVTNGQMIQGSEINDLPQQKWSTIEDSNYIPVVPSPPIPESSGNTFIGDDIDYMRAWDVGAATDFMTQYCLTPNQLSLFGGTIWESMIGESNNIRASLGRVQTGEVSGITTSPQDVMENITSLRLYPFTLEQFANYQSKSPTMYFGLGNASVTLNTSTNIGVMETYAEIMDGGTVEVPRYYNDWRDFVADYSVHVPFCGSAKLPNIVAGKTLKLLYGVDFATGGIIATVSIIGENTKPVAQLAGQIGANVPLAFSGEIGVGKQIGVIGNAVSGLVSSVVTKNPLPAISAGINTVNYIEKSKPVYNLSPGSDFSAVLAPALAYITCTWDKYEFPIDYGRKIGYACNFSSVLSDLSGFTVCSNVDVSGISAFDDEKQEIKQLLETGIFV